MLQEWWSCFGHKEKHKNKLCSPQVSSSILLHLEVLWSLTSILDSCRFLNDKNQIFILRIRRISVGCWVYFGATTSVLSSSSRSASLSGFLSLLVSDFFSLLRLMFDLMNWSKNDMFLVYITCCTCGICSGLDVMFWWFMIKHARFSWKWRYDVVCCL